MVEEEEFYKAKISELEKKRLDLQEELGRLRKHAEKHKELRDKKNSEVKATIQALKEVREKRKEKIGEMSGLKEELREVKDKLRKAIEEKRKINWREYPNGEEIKHRIDCLEWKIQITPLSLEEEKKVVAEIARLEREALEAEEQRKAYERACQHIGELETKRESILSRINALKEEIAELDAKINVMEEKFRAAKEEADQAHRNYLELFEKIIKIENELEKLVEEERIYRRMYFRVFERKKEEEEKEKRRILEEKAVAIREKLKRGEKVNIHELRIIFLGEEER